MAFKTFEINLNEAYYKGNIGLQEVMKFMEIANPTQKRELKSLIDKKNFSDAWDLIELVTGMTLHR